MGPLHSNGFGRIRAMLSDEKGDLDADLRLRLRQMRPSIRNAGFLVGDSVVPGLREHRSYSATVVDCASCQSRPRRSGVRPDGLVRRMLAITLRLIRISPIAAHLAAVAGGWRQAGRSCRRLPTSKS